MKKQNKIKSFVIENTWFPREIDTFKEDPLFGKYFEIINDLLRKLKDKNEKNLILGWGNGYVVIPKEHPLYGKDCEEINDLL